MVVVGLMQPNSSLHLLPIQSIYQHSKQLAMNSSMIIEGGLVIVPEHYNYILELLK